MKEKEQSIANNWNDPDDAPEWTDEVFARAEIRHGEKLVREATGTLTKRGRPRITNPKRHVSLRLDSEVIERFRATGPGWQGRINDILRKAVQA